MTKHTNEDAIARLNAAAPDLLAALELAARYLEHPDVLRITNRMALPGSLGLQRVMAALAKARGEA